MSSKLKSRLLQRSFLTRLLQTTGLSLALMTASATLRAEVVTVQGANGANGADGFDFGEAGGAGEPAVANAGSVHPITFPLNKAMATGGTGGAGGSALCGDVPSGFAPCHGFDGGSGGPGGPGGQAGATAATTINSGSAEADAISVGGTGGRAGFGVVRGGLGGPGGPATALATGSSGSGNVTASASATGGDGGSRRGQLFAGSVGGDASASSKAIANGSGNASSSATAAGGSPGSFGDIAFVPQSGANATANASGGGTTTANAVATGHSGNGAAADVNAMANASATGGGTATANAVATGGGGFGSVPGAATSNAETANGATAQALSTAVGVSGAAHSTAKTSFEGVSVQSNVMGPFEATAMTNAIAQGGSGQAFVNPGQNPFAFSTAVPDKAYATTLIGGASNVADALLGPRDKVFGTAILGRATSAGDATSTFNFRFSDDLLLGLISGSGHVGVFGNGIGMSLGNFVDDSVINLGSRFGPNIDLSVEIIGGSGAVAIGGVIPETSTWAMMLLGFAGLGFVGYRQTRRAKPQAA